MRNSSKALLVAGALASFPVFSTTYDISFTRSAYTVGQQDNFADLLNAHNQGEVLATYKLSGLDRVDSSEMISGSNRNHSVYMTTTFTLHRGGSADFQVGADWGRGGGIAIYDEDDGSLVSEQVVADDIWWGNDWNNPDVLSTNFEFTPGAWRVSWVGFEGCCSGSTSIRYSINGGAYFALTESNFSQGINQEVPLPGSILFFASALGILVARKRNIASPERSGLEEL